MSDVENGGEREIWETLRSVEMFVRRENKEKRSDGRKGEGSGEKDIGTSENRRTDETKKTQLRMKRKKAYAN